MKKFHITDEDGRTCTVEEIEEIKDDNETTSEAVSTLTEDEITALKSLAASAPQLLALLKVKEKEHEAMSDEDESDKNPEDEETDIEDADEDEDEDINEDKEKIVDTDEDKETSMKDSVGRIDRRTVAIDDSIDNAIDIDNAFRKYYGGKK